MISTAAIEALGENVMHYGGVRLRVNGTGYLVPTWSSLDNEKSQQLTPFAMKATTGIEPFKLSNFITQRAFLRLETIAINETFRINRVVVFVKPIYGQYFGE